MRDQANPSMRRRLRQSQAGGAGGGLWEGWEGLEHTWPLSADGFDVVGEADLTNNNGVTFVPLGPSGVVAFTAGDDLESLSSASNPFAAASAATVNFWLKYEAHHGNGSLFTLDNAGPDRLFYHATSNSFWYVFDTTQAFEVISYDVLANPGWHMITLTVDGTERKLRLYSDGVLQATSAALANPVNFASAGFIDLSQSGQFSGKYANFGTWSTVIDGATITSLFNGGKGKRYADLTTADKVGLLQYANFDEVSGNRLDSHGANDFTDNNTVGSTTNSYPANMPGTVANFVGASAQTMTRALATPLAFGNTDWSGAVWLNTAEGEYFLDLQSNWDLQTFGGRVYFSVLAPSVQLPSANATYQDGAWHLVLVWHDATAGKIYIQVDDSAVAEAAATPTATAGETLIFGGSSLAGGFDGMLSGTYVWSRVLTPTERAGLWNGGAGRFFPN